MFFPLNQFANHPAKNSFINTNDLKSIIPLFLFGMNKKVIYLLLSCIAIVSQAQNKWDLKKCVEYAQKNNVSVLQADVQARIAKLEVERTRLAQHPNLSFGTNIGGQFGRSVDPTSNQFVNTQLLFNGLNLNANVPVYNWGALKLNREIAAFNANAAQLDVQRITNDIALNVATFYLQVLAAKQQIEIVKVQISQTQTQQKFTRLRVQAGALPELSAAEMEAQLARDSVSYINSVASFEQAVLQLKAAINLPMQEAFDVDIPPVETIFIEPLAELEPATLYALALTNQPLQKVNQQTIKGLEKSIKLAKTQFYPTISAFASLGSNFANSSQEFKGFNVIGTKATPYTVNVGGTNYVVSEPDIQVITGKRSFFNMWQGFGRQLDNNFRQNFGFQISVPIANNGNAKLGLQRSELNLKQAQQTAQQNNLTLQQNIYQSYTNAVAATKRLALGKKSVELAEISYNYAVKRFEAGLGTTLDLITNQNNLLRSKTELLNSTFDYVFRMKLLEFYKGQGIKL